MALNDLDTIIELFKHLKEEEKQDHFYLRLNIRVYAKYYSLFAIKGEFEKALESIQSLFENQLFLDEKMIDMKVADDYLKNSRQEEAKKLYLEILETEPDNDKIIANLSLIFLNSEQYEDSIEYCNKAIALIKNFKEKFSLMKKFDNSYEIKILLRRAKCYEKLNYLEKSQKDIESIERLEIKNDLISDEIKNIRNSILLKLFEKNQKIANDFLAKKEYANSLEYYNKCISLQRHALKIEVIKTHINRTSCFIYMQQYENVIKECSNLLQSIHKQKNIFIINSDDENFKKMGPLEFLVYVRRAVAFTEQGKYFEALEDYTKASEIDPNDQKIKDAIKKIKVKL